VSDQLDRMRLKYGFWIIMTGFDLVAFITLVSIFAWSAVTSVATVVGAASSLVGTVVGAFFGVQFGSAGKERAEAARDRSQEIAEVALSMLPPLVRRAAAIRDGPIEKPFASAVRYLPTRGKRPEGLTGVHNHAGEATGLTLQYPGYSLFI
jgi:hypothetical protein